MQVYPCYNAVNLKFFNARAITLQLKCEGCRKTTDQLFVVVVVLLFYVHGKHLRSCQDGQLIYHTFHGQA